MLNADDFSGFFREVHGYWPFPWQMRLLAEVAAKGEWPRVLDLPTGSGKTAAIDIAVFHLALQANLGPKRRAPIRIAFVVDRRLVVDDSYLRARKIEAALAKPTGNVSKRVAARLGELSGDGPPLVARRLRGGIPREHDWARTPSQPTVLCSTVDQIGSRLLFRGYGVSDSMKPVHAGLIGSDCLILLDEAHLAEPFRQTLGWIKAYQDKKWRTESTAGPWQTVLLTATPGEKLEGRFALDDEDRSNAILKTRLQAEKPARLVAPIKPKKTVDAAASDDEEKENGDAENVARRALAIVQQVGTALKHFEADSHGAPRPAIGVVVNRVGRAREVCKQLQKAFPQDVEDAVARDCSPEIILMIGPARPVDRDDLARKLAPIRTGEDRNREKPLILVATQCIEAGVDIDLDALVTEVAPLDSLRQRFGRLNRAGRKIVPYAAIVADKSDIAARTDDPVYGEATKPAWDYLSAWAKEAKAESVDFGIDAMQARIAAHSEDQLAVALTEKPDAPVLLPAHVDLLSQTSPVPNADPDIALYLHGPDRQLDSITVIWRADIDPAHITEGMVRLLTLVPPRSGEAIALPVWTVRRWLERRGAPAPDIADMPQRDAGDDAGKGGRRIFRWKGANERSQWIDPSALRPGDTIVAPARYGGVDEFGWNPESQEPAQDVAHRAAKPFARKMFAVRVAPGLLGPHVTDDMLAAILASLREENAQTVRQALLELDLPGETGEALRWLGSTNIRRAKQRIVADFDVYGTNEKGEPRGVVLLAPFGVELPASLDTTKSDGDDDGRPSSTEDDWAGSIFDVPLSLKQHSSDVERKAEKLAGLAGLAAARVTDLRVAGFLHDQGKRDPRFQAWLHYGDSLGFDPDDETDILAKSGRALPPAAREKSGLPDRWRHEALSVKLARQEACLGQASDRDLVLWLVGTHHGYGRPFFPHRDPDDQEPVGPQSLAFDWDGLDWASLFVRLKARYGVWELARMEAILRLADHLASEDARTRFGNEAAE